MSDRSSDAEVTLGVTAFKPRSLDLIEKVASGKLNRVVLTKRGRPVVALVPLDEGPENLWGALANLMQPVEGVDLTAPTGERWVAEDG
ncbi:MAG: type II toxin-antitoxin system Phd/YefM family antitoxin [Geminicoccaceae bacterium]